MKKRMPDGQSKPRLLVVEDDEDYREVLLRTIEKVNKDRGWDVLALASVKDAELAVSHTTVDLLVTDYHLPDGLGTVVTRSTPTREGKARRILLSGDADNVQRAWRDEPDIVDDIWDKDWAVNAIADRLDAAMTKVESARRKE